MTHSFIIINNSTEARYTLCDKIKVIGLLLLLWLNRQRCTSIPNTCPVTVKSRRLNSVQGSYLYTRRKGVRSASGNRESKRQEGHERT